MKKIFLLLTLFIVLFQVDAISKTKKRKKKRKATVTKTTTVIADSLKLKTLVVSFISMGAGIDYKTVPEFEQSLKEFNDSHKNSVQSTIKKWGREGERDYCLMSDSPNDLKTFSILLKEKYKENKRILIMENAKCKQ